MLSKADIKLYKTLNKKKYRNINNLFIIEGGRLVSEAIPAQVSITRILTTDTFLHQHSDIIDLITQHAIPSEAITETEMKAVSNTVTPSGIMAICQIPNAPKINLDTLDNWLFLDTIQDPGNLGTLLRSASWFGIKNIALSENCIDIYNPKVLRGGMGSHFTLNIHQEMSIKAFANHTIFGAFQDCVDINDSKIKTLIPWVLVIGNEAHGISDDVSKNIDVKITIPKIGSGESLNAAIAGSILLYRLTGSI